MTKKFFSNFPDDLVLSDDFVEKKIIKEYGAIFVAGNGAIPPNRVVYKNEQEVDDWQTQIPQAVKNIGGFIVELQIPAMNSLLCAVSEAAKTGLTITPRGADSAKRNYSETIRLWESRVNPGLIHWVEQGNLSAAKAAKIRILPPHKQVSEIFKLELRGMYFAKDLSKSIIYSVAPPGTSQHISMLALDINEFDNFMVLEILANHGWFQTVVSDLPHFTYLGAKENDLPNLGLKKISDGGRVYWIPNM